MGDISTDILLIVLAGLLGGVLASFLRMPLLIGYLLAGLLVGPHTMGPRVTDLDAVGKLADIGAALLLFSLGLEFPLKSLKQIRNVAFFGSAIQVVLTFLFCWFLGRQLGLDTAPSMWFAAAFLSSSTAVILKTLANQGYAGALSGRIMLGMSIVQDLTVIPVMILLTNYSRASGSTLEFLLPLIYAGIFVLLMGVLGFFHGDAGFASVAFFISFAILWGINGWTQSMGSPPGIINLSRWFPLNKRGTYYGIFSASPYIGEFLSFIVIGAIVGTFGWQSGFIFSAVAGIAGTLVILFCVSDTPESKGLPSVQALSSEEMRAEDRMRTSEVQKIVLRHPGIWIIAAASASADSCG